MVTAGRSRRAAVAEQGRRGRRPAGAPETLSRPRPRPGRERSMTVSLEDTLEDEDTLSRWPPGSSRRHSRSPAVASEYTVGQGPARGRHPPGISGGTFPSPSALLTVWLPGAPSQAPPGPPPLYTRRWLSGACSVSPLLWVLSWKGVGAPRATTGGLATSAAGPDGHGSPPGEGLGGAATRGGGPGPGAGSSAMVSRPRREEPGLCAEKGRVSVDERRRACRAHPPGTVPAGPPTARPLGGHAAAPHPALRLCRCWGWWADGPVSTGRVHGARPTSQAGDGTGCTGDRGTGPHYLALGCSQSLTTEAAWGQKGEQSGQHRGGAARWTNIEAGRVQGWRGGDSSAFSPSTGRGPVTAGAQRGSGHK